MIDVHARICHHCIIVTPSSHWVVMAPAKTWRWRIIATWICERKAKSLGGITSLSFCFSLSWKWTRLSSEMQSSPSSGRITIFWIKLGCCWSMWQPCRSQMKLSSWCTRESPLLGHRMKVSWMISKFSLIAGGNCYQLSGQPRSCVEQKAERTVIPPVHKRCIQHRLSPPHHCSP